MVKQDYILSGDEFTGEEFLGSLAEYLIPKMKKHPRDSIVQLDSKTGNTITSYEFLKTSLEIAEGLRRVGLKDRDVVMLASPNNIPCHLMAAGILFSGGVTSAIDQNLKPIEIQHLIKQFRPKFIACESQKAKDFQKSMKLAGTDSKIILLDSPTSIEGDEFLYWNSIRTDVDVDNYVPRKVEDPKTTEAIICCSSGSTGLPKGVALSHYNIIFNDTILNDLGLKGVDQNVLMISPLFWISGIMILFITLGSGQTRYIPKSLTPEDILEGLEKHKPFSIMLSPAFLLNIVDCPNFKKYNLESTKLVLTGGSMLSKSIAEKVRKLWDGIIFFQGYGMTEVIGPITLPTGNEDLMTIGHILREYKAKVVDVATGESLGPNKVGELRIKTKRLMLGYYNNEEATKAAFDEDGWFRTGDLVYYDDKKLLYIVGRIKEVIKYRNYQISPTEIESFIIGLPGVKDVAIVPVPHEEDSYHLKALVVRSPKSDITAEEIIQSVKENLSESKHLRKGVQFVDELPRTEVGKLKRGEVISMGAI